MTPQLQSKKRMRRKHRSKQRPLIGRFTLVLIALFFGLLIGYYLPDLWPSADRTLRKHLPYAGAHQPEKPSEPVIAIDLPAPVEVFRLPVAVEGDWETEHLPFGRPRGECADCTEVVREGYALQHDNERKVPRWVAWRLDPEDTQPGVSRSDNFREDPAIPAHGRAALADYRGSGFDRGHVAPAADMKKNRTTMSESFYLSNMMPQTARLNRQEWRVLEEAIRSWLPRRRQLWIIAGPGFDEGGGNATRTIGPGRVHVPTHCWKIVVDQQEDGSFTALAVWMLNVERDVPDWRESQVTINDLEAWTGLDFLPALPDGMEEELESRMDAW